VGISGASEPEALFAVDKVSDENGGLEVILTPLVERPEIRGNPVLRVGDQRVTGDLRMDTDGRLHASFEQAPDTLARAVIELPAVSFSVVSTTSQSANSDVFHGPGGEALKVTETRINEEFDSLSVHYEPEDTSTVSPARAVIREGDTIVRSIGAGASYDTDWQVTHGDILFPVEARELLKSENVTLEIVLFRNVVAPASIPLD
ncbi:MAG: hypothetical protein WD848_03920, partial [Dehalococcoidia bacterium]